MLSLVLFLSLSVIVSGGYECPNKAYAERTPEWQKLVKPYCGKFNEENAKKASACITDNKVPLESAVNTCLQKTGQKPMSMYDFFMALCNSKPQDIETLICCISDTLVQQKGVESDPVKRGDVYKKCWEASVQS